MNKLLQHIMAAGDVSHKYLPHLEKYQTKGQVQNTGPMTMADLIEGARRKPTYDRIPTPGSMSEKAKHDAAAKVYAAIEKQGEIRPAGPKRSAVNKAWEGNLSLNTPLFNRT